jgi:hypothetical protein
MSAADKPRSDPAAVPPAAPRENVIAREWRKIRPYLGLLDFAKRPETKAGWIVRILALSIALFALWKRVDLVTTPMLATKPPLPIPTEEIEDYRFRLPEHTRREIFAELATAELAERARAIGANTWNGHLWSREDDRGHYERVAARNVAAKYKISLTQVYLVLDEGLRNHWPAPDGKPLPPTTPPLSTRSTW